MQYKLKSVIITLLFGLLLPTMGQATDSLLGLPVSSDGGLLVGNPKVDPYWFQVSGDMKIDQRTYWGDTSPTNFAGLYQSGAFIRAAGLSFEGGAGRNFTYTLALAFEPKASTSRIDDAYITYQGMKWLMPNFTFSIGQVVPGFCITCAASGKWIPFLERSMGTNAFGPRQGLGISANTYNNNYSLTVAATQQPPTGTQVVDPRGNVIIKPDLWQGAFRLTYAPIAETGKVMQMGFSAHIKEDSNTGLQFATNPEMRSGNSITLLNTTTVLAKSGVNPAILIAAKNQKTIDAEFLGIYGPLSGELEYQQVWVSRGKVNDVVQGPNLTFNGYHAQVAYVLTGESRPHKKSNGTTGQIKPKSKCGAWEVAGRFSFITLNDKDISGGMAHNTSASLAWYANDNVKFIGEYVYSKQSRAFPTYFDKRQLQSIGMRMQVVF